MDDTSIGSLDYDQPDDATNVGERDKKPPALPT